ncbi:hypothetical protein BC832DRAFT_613995 [Gaertneriomyces semiglobifer]|nr:hypothetical protein BC832DRAFT_613995 [Gaertneriomyces semiglobifer]
MSLNNTLCRPLDLLLSKLDDTEVDRAAVFSQTADEFQESYLAILSRMRDEYSQNERAESDPESKRIWKSKRKDGFSTRAGPERREYVFRRDGISEFPSNLKGCACKCEFVLRFGELKSAHTMGINFLMNAIAGYRDATARSVEERLRPKRARQEDTGSMASVKRARPAKQADLLAPPSLIEVEPASASSAEPSSPFDAEPLPFEPEVLDALEASIHTESPKHKTSWVLDGKDMRAQFEAFQFDALELARSGQLCYRDHLEEIFALHLVCLIERNRVPKWAHNIALSRWTKEFDRRNPTSSVTLPATASHLVTEYTRFVIDHRLEDFQSLWLERWQNVATAAPDEQRVLIIVQLVSRALALGLMQSSSFTDEDSFVHTYLHELLVECLRGDAVTVSWANGESEASKERRQQYGRRGGKRPDFRSFVRDETRSDRLVTREVLYGEFKSAAVRSVAEVNKVILKLGEFCSAALQMKNTTITRTYGIAALNGCLRQYQMTPAHGWLLFEHRGSSPLPCSKHAFSVIPDLVLRLLEIRAEILSPIPLADNGLQTVGVVFPTPKKPLPNVRRVSQQVTSVSFLSRLLATKTSEVVPLVSESGTSARSKIAAEQESQSVIKIHIKSKSGKTLRENFQITCSNTAMWLVENLNLPPLPSGEYVLYTTRGDLPLGGLLSDHIKNDETIFVKKAGVEGGIIAIQSICTTLEITWRDLACGDQSPPDHQLAPPWSIKMFATEDNMTVNECRMAVREGWKAMYLAIVRGTLTSLATTEQHYKDKIIHYLFEPLFEEQAFTFLEYQRGEIENTQRRDHRQHFRSLGERRLPGYTHDGILNMRVLGGWYHVFFLEVVGGPGKHDDGKHEEDMVKCFKAMQLALFSLRKALLVRGVLPSALRFLESHSAVVHQTTIV